MTPTVKINLIQKDLLDEVSKELEKHRAVKIVNFSDVPEASESK